MSDPISAFGGVVLFNKKINTVLSKKINSRFFEAIVAPKIYNKTLEILNVKKKLIIIDSYGIKNKNKQIFKSVNAGVLYQEENQYKVTKSKIKLVSKKSASKATIEDLIFAFKVAKHVKSNAIVLANNKQTLGIGAGQMSRLDSTRMAILKYKDFFKNRTFVCASDAFFPFTDNLQKLLKFKCKAIVQPSGSINDHKVIAYAKKNKISLFFCIFY